MKRFAFMQIGVAMLIVGLFCLLTGCMTPAQKLDEKAVIGQLHEGQTQTEVRQMFGQPKRSELGSNGNKLDMFAVAFSMIPKAGQMHVTTIRSLHVLYNPKGRVDTFSYYVGETRGYAVRRGEPWRSGHLLNDEKVNQIKRNATTRNELVQLFGPATVEGLDINGNKTMSWAFFEGRNASLTSGRELFVRLNASWVVADYLLRNIQP